jgi:hypothetical protein
MATLQEWAKAYEDKRLRNIAELDSISIDLEIKHDKIGSGEDEREYAYIEVDGDRFEVKKSVLSQLKTLLADEKINFDKFKVLKSGENMATKYQVLPLV